MDLKLLQAELESLRLENETLKKEMAENAPDKLKEMAARAQADLQNAKDRMERDARDLRKFAVQSVIRPQETRDYLIRMLEVHQLRLTKGVGRHLMCAWPTSY